MSDELYYNISICLLKNYKNVLENCMLTSNDNTVSKLLKDEFPFNLDLAAIDVLLDKKLKKQ